MASLIGLHAIVLRDGVAAQELERVMTTNVFPAAAEVTGSVNRGGASVIGSQHLLKSAEDGSYLWLVKATDAFDPGGFAEVFRRMYDDLQATIEPVGRLESSTVFSVPAGYDAGPRDTLGRRVGEPQRGQFL
jgi:hypothetical protein